MYIWPCLRNPCKGNGTLLHPLFRDFHELRDCCTEFIGTHTFFDKHLKNNEERIWNAVGIHRNAWLFYRFAEGLHGTHRSAYRHYDCLFFLRRGCMERIWNAYISRKCFTFYWGFARNAYGTQPLNGTHQECMRSIGGFISRAPTLNIRKGQPLPNLVRNASGTHAPSRKPPT